MRALCGAIIAAGGSIGLGLSAVGFGLRGRRADGGRQQRLPDPVASLRDRCSPRLCHYLSDDHARARGWRSPLSDSRITITTGTMNCCACRMCL